MNNLSIIAKRFISYLYIIGLRVTSLWIIWTWFGLGAEYFSFLPELYQSIPYLKFVGLATLYLLLKVILIDSRNYKNN